MGPFFNKKLTNGEIISRAWLCFSPKTQMIYYFICKLFSSNLTNFTKGYNDWKHVYEKVSAHENSDNPRSAHITMMNMSNTIQRIDKDLIKQIETRYWLDVLRSTIDVITFICERGLAFKGSDQDIGSNHNGNYLGIGIIIEV